MTMAKNAHNEASQSNIYARVMVKTPIERHNALSAIKNKSKSILNVNRYQTKPVIL